MTEKKKRRKLIVIDRKLGVKVGRKTYYPLPKMEVPPAAPVARDFTEILAANFHGDILAATFENPCTGRANNSSCGSNCVCVDHHPRYSVDGLRALGFTLSKLE